jgi:hypothetical protein
MRTTLLNPLFGVPDVVHRLGRGVWLYLWLLTAVNAHGLVCRSVRTIANRLHRPEGEILDWLGRLVGLGLIEVRAPAPNLVIKLAMWPGNSRANLPNPSETASQSKHPREFVPVSRLQHAGKQAANENIAGGGVPGEGGGLEAELIETLGGTDAASILDSLADVPETLVRKALTRVRATPSEKIKKSRLALFRYLLTQLRYDDIKHTHS